STTAKIINADESILLRITLLMNRSMLQGSLTLTNLCCCKSCCEADRSILLQILLLMNRSMLLMNRVAERCHRDLKYSNAADEDAQSNAAISTAADHDVGE